MDIWMIYYRQTLTWKLGEVRIRTISQDNLHLAMLHHTNVPTNSLLSSYWHWAQTWLYCWSSGAVVAVLQHFLTDLLCSETGGARGATVGSWNDTIINQSSITDSLALLTWQGLTFLSRFVDGNFPKQHLSSPLNNLSKLWGWGISGLPE